MKFFRGESTVKKKGASISRLLACGVLAALSWPLWCAAASPAQADPSSFQRSCGNIGVSGDLLFADCRRIDGSWTQTSIRIPGIENIDGDLEYTGGASSFQRSCDRIGVSGDMLFAECRRIDGSWNSTSIAIPDIANIDGRLEYQ
jgi:hypothetical protein